MLVDATGSEVAAQEISSEAKEQGTSSKAKKLRDREDFPITLFHSHHEKREMVRELTVVAASRVFFSVASFAAQMPELRCDCTFDLTDAALRSVKQTHCKLFRIEAGNDTTRPAHQTQRGLIALSRLDAAEPVAIRQDNRHDQPQNKTKKEKRRELPAACFHAPAVRSLLPPTGSRTCGSRSHSTVTCWRTRC